MGPFLFRKHRLGIQELLHHVNNIEHYIKHNIYTGMGLISIIPPRYIHKNNLKIKYTNNTLLVNMRSYLRNQQPKETNKPCRFTISFELSTLFQKLVQKVVKKGISSMKVYYIIQLKYRLTGHPEIFKIKLYYLQERLDF